MTVTAFVAKLRDRGIEIGLPTVHTIPKVLADRLTDTVEVDFTSLKDDELVHAYSFYFCLKSVGKIQILNCLKRRKQPFPAHRERGLSLLETSSIFLA